MCGGIEKRNIRWHIGSLLTAEGKLMTRNTKETEYLFWVSYFKMLWLWLNSYSNRGEMVQTQIKRTEMWKMLENGIWMLSKDTSRSTCKISE